MRRQVVEELADLMEARFAEFDGDKRMSEEDTTQYSLHKASIHIRDAYSAEVFADQKIVDQKIADAANRLALAFYVAHHDITDEGVNE